MKTINGVLICRGEIKIGAGSCKLFVVDLEGKEGQEIDTALTLPLTVQWEKETDGRKGF